MGTGLIRLSLPGSDWDSPLYCLWPGNKVSWQTDNLLWAWMPGLLSCVSGLSDLGAGEADTRMCQWPPRNLGGRKNPVSQLKLNTVKEFSKFHAANQSDIRDTRYARKFSQPTPGGLDRGVHPLPIFPKRSVSQR